MLIKSYAAHRIHLFAGNINKMADVTTGTKGAKWVCPNDRQLALRAKLSTGWSVKTQDLKEYGKRPQALNEMEQNAIKQVIQRAEMLELREQERVGRLVDRLDNMKRNIMGNGTTQCILCGDTFRFFGASNFLCSGCKKLVCEKCGIEISSSTQETIYLCKICSETREMWKKSGAWFFKGLPKYKLPEKKSDKYGMRKIIRPGVEMNSWSKSNTDLAETSSRNEVTGEEQTNLRGGGKSQSKSIKPPEDSSKNVNKTSSSLSVSQCEKSPKSTGGTSSASGSLFFNTSSDSGVGESERNPDKTQSPKDKYQREPSAESSESNHSSFSQQTSSTFSESQQNLTYLSSAAHPYDRSPLNYKSDCSLNCDTVSMYGHSSQRVDKSKGFPKSPQDERYHSPLNKPSFYQELTSKKLPVPSMTRSLAGSSTDTLHQSYTDVESQKYRKKISIDFGKATSFFKYPLKSDKKKDKNKLSKFSSSESHLDSSTESGRDLPSAEGVGGLRGGGGDEKNSDNYSDSDRSSRQLDTLSVLGANHWLSQESNIHTYDSLSDLNPKWSRRESMTSLSRDYWSEDQISLSSSLGANQEDMSEAIGGQNAQLGMLEISLWYDPVRSSLYCTLHRGKGLKSTDINGLADPFCKLNILPTSGKSNRMKTKTVHKTTNPEFNETVNFYGITETDIQKKTLHILVLDDDKYGNDFLGEARIPLFKVGAKQTKHVSVFLEKHCELENENEIWGEDNWNRGQILVTLCYSTKKRALIVLIGRCTNLLPMDNNGLSDPFVKLHLTPDSNHKRCKTSVKWKNLNPIFNEEFVFETKMTDLPKQTLVLTVWDKDYGKSNDYLGGLELGWRSKGERLKHWIDMIKFPDHKHEGWHKLGEDLIND